MKKISLMIIIAILLSACSASNKSSGEAAYNNMVGAAPQATPAPSFAAPDIARDESGGVVTEEADYDREMAATDSAAMEPGFGTDGGNTTISGKQPDISQTDPNRKLIYTANMSVETLSFEESVSNLESLCASFQGYIESSSISGTSITMRGKQFRTASYTFRIPSKFYKDFINAMGTVGNITNKSQETQDISDSYYDIESRLKVLEMRRDRLFKLLETEMNSKAIIEFENSLSETLYEIDRLTGTLKKYDALVDYSIVHVFLMEVEKYTDILEYTPAPQTVAERIKSSFGDSTEEISEFLVDVFVSLVGNILYIMIWGAIITICVIVIGTKVKRSRQRKQQSKNEENNEKGDQS